jgi:hypothetical protein
MQKLLISVSVCAAGISLSACETTDRTQPASPAGDVQVGEVEREDKVEQIQEKPEHFYGKTVALFGEVDDVKNDRAFVVEGNDWLFDEELLVVTKSPVQLGVGGIEEDQHVVVRGIVRPFTVTEIERELGWDVDTEIETRYRDKPVLLADSVRVMGEYGRWSEAEEPQGLVVSYWGIYETSRPEDFVGRQVEFESVPVQAKAGSGLWIGFSHSDMMFVTIPPQFDVATVQVGDKIALSGRIQRMPPAEEAMKRWKFDPTLKNQVEQEVLYIEAEALKKAEQKGEPKPGPQAQAGTQTVQFAQFAKDPKQAIGSQVRGDATVDQVVSNRAFWVKDDAGNRVLAVIRDEVPKEQALDIKVGQRVAFNAIALAPDRIGEIAGTLDNQLKRTIEQQSAFLAVNRGDITTMAGA